MRRIVLRRSFVQTQENFRFFRRHSGLLGHDIAHVGNPDATWLGDFKIIRT